MFGGKGGGNTAGIWNIEARVFSRYILQMG